MSATILVSGATAVGAHAYLQSSDPSQSEVLLVVPRQVELHFDEPVEIDFGSIRVFGPGGRRVDEGGTHHPGTDTHAVAISLPADLPQGSYVVAWRVISADSHPVHGAYLFSVGNAGGAAKAGAVAKALNAASGSTLVGAVYGVIRFVVFAALLVVVGLALVIELVSPAAWRVRRLRRTSWMAWGLLVLGTVSAIAVQGVYAAALPVGHAFSPSLFGDVLHTRFGEVQVLRLILLGLAVPAMRAVARRGVPGSGASPRWSMAALMGLGAGLLLTPGLAGHAATGGSPVVGESLDFVHLAGAAVWIGGLTLLVLLLLPGVPESERPAEVLDVAGRFSPYAVVAVVAVVASGTVQSLRQVGSWYALWHTVYGRTLFVKVILVALLVGLGWVSRRLVLGHWTWARRTKTGAGADGGVGPSPRRPRRLRRSVLAESTMVVSVLVATVLLVNAAPARQAASQPFTQSFDVLGLQVNAIVDPARVGGGNQVHVYLLGRLGQPVAVPELDAAVSLSSAGIGPITLPMALAGPGHYRASMVVFPLAGPWTLKVTVRTSAIDEQEVFATVPVH